MKWIHLPNSEMIIESSDSLVGNLKARKGWRKNIQLITKYMAAFFISETTMPRAICIGNFLPLLLLRMYCKVFICVYVLYGLVSLYLRQVEMYFGHHSSRENGFGSHIAPLADDKLNLSELQQYTNLKHKTVLSTMTTTPTTQRNETNRCFGCGVCIYKIHNILVYCTRTKWHQAILLCHLFVVFRVHLFYLHHFVLFSESSVFIFSSVFGFVIIVVESSLCIVYFCFDLCCRWYVCRFCFAF